jgi:hypothetical protein
MQINDSLLSSCQRGVFLDNHKKDVIDSIWKSSFSETELDKIPHFYMQGGLNYEKMDIADRLVMKTLAKMLKIKANKNSTEKGTEQAISRSYDNSSREQITPLIQYIKAQEIIEIKRLENSSHGGTIYY